MPSLTLLKERSSAETEAVPIETRETPNKSVSPIVSLGGGVLLGLLLLGLYWHILLGLVDDWWNDPNYSHGFLVPLFSGYLLWQKRETLQVLPREGSWWGLFVFLGGLGALILGDLMAEDFVMRSSLVIVISGLLLFHVGVPFVRVSFFPLLFLFFMVPLPTLILNAVAFPLQGLAAQNATWGLDVLGVPVLRDGNVIHLSHITLGVTEACSGIRSLISLLAVAVAWGHVTLSRRWMRWLFVASAVPITIVANAGRVILTGLVGLWFGEAYAQGVYHSFAGWAIFIFAFVCLSCLHMILQRFQPTAREEIL